MKKASKHDKLLRMINEYNRNVYDYVKEPQQKAEEQLEKINKEIEFFNLSKKSRLQ